MTDQPTADKLVADARRAVHEALIVLPAPEADRARSLIADLETAVEARTAMRQPAVPVSSPPPDQTALRDRIAEVLVTTSRAEWPYKPGMEKFDHHKHGDRPGHTYSISCALCTGDVDRLADVLAAVPPPADRAAVLREAANVIDNPPNARAAGNAIDAAFMAARSEMADKLRRMAGSTSTAVEAQLHAPEHTLPTVDRTAVLLKAADDLSEFIALHGPTSRTVAGWRGAVGFLRRLAVEAQQPEPEGGCAHCGSTDHVWDDCEDYTELVRTTEPTPEPPPVHKGGNADDCPA